MGLPKYVVNFDELVDLLGGGINIDVTVGDSEVLDYNNLAFFVSLMYNIVSIGGCASPL